MYLNAQSARNKHDYICCHVKESNCDIIVITETWYYANETYLFTINGYEGVHSCRDTRGGGCSIFVRDTLKFSVVEVSNDKRYNHVSIKLLDNNIKIIGIYRPPSYMFNDFLLELENILNRCITKSILIGDINIDLLKNNSPEFNTYINTIALRGFKICNVIDENYATRAIANSKSILDHVLTNKNLDCNIAIQNHITDHKILNIELITNIKSPQAKKKLVHKKMVLNQNNFIKKFQQLVNNHEIDTFEMLSSAIQVCKKESTSQYEIKYREGKDWITKEFLELIKKRDKLYLEKIKHPFNQDTAREFQKQKNIVENKRKKLKQEYFRKKWNETGNNQKKQWKFINSLIKGKNKKSLITNIDMEGKILDDPKNIAEKMNQYFIDIGKSIINNVNSQTASTVNFEEISSDCSMNLYKTNAQEVQEALYELNKNAAPGYDNIYTKDLLTLKNCIVPILVKLINLSFKQGIFPDVLKVSKVSPIHKSGPTNIIDNYRPISVVPTLSKVIEIILKKRIINYISNCVHFDEYQYGFQEKSSTLSATIDFINHIASALDDKYYTLAVFVDLRKAFDVVDFSILLRKIQEMGIRGTALSLIKTYLQGREQFTVVDGVSSQTQNTKAGVPQGSVLGPLLYTLHVLSLKTSNIVGRYFKFADDTVLVYKGKDWKQLETTVNDDLKKYHSWLIKNKLQLNVKKTTYMTFFQKNMNLQNIKVEIGGEEITRVHSTKYLGLVVDENLCWNSHITHIEKKVIPMVGAIYRCRDYLSPSSLHQIYSAYFLSIFSYLIPLWGTCGQTLFKKVNTLQNKVVKILFGLDYRMSTDTLYRVTKILPIQNILAIEQSKFAYKVIKNESKCNTNIVFVNQLHEYNTRAYNNVFLEPVRTNIGLNNPIAQCMKIYNTLPKKIRDSPNITIFKNEIKNYHANFFDG